MIASRSGSPKCTIDIVQSKARINIRLEFWEIDERNKKGETLWMEDKIQEALTSFSEATKLEPDNAVALYKEGAALISLDRYSEGLEIIQKAIILKPRDAVGFVRKASQQ
ncbi:MAG: tetratricopeptide repeat protein [Candidatus Heimdallarchaeota archaeon]|nr:tetratricopeptide repeat protein [Candidatus Heimdallarchaeota archaeon]